MTIPTNAEVIAALVAPGVSWASSSITFSFPKGADAWHTAYDPDAAAPAGFGVLDAATANVVRSAMSVWGSFIARPLVETDDPAHPGQIRVAFLDTEPIGAAFSTYPPETGAAERPAAGDVWLGFQIRDQILSATYEVILHEIGHSLGLKHPQDTPNALAFEWTNTLYSIMGYDHRQDGHYFTFAPDATPGGSGYRHDIVIVGQKTPMTFDVLAIQSIYGANPATAAGDTRYDWDPAKPAFETVYDAGGADTFDLSAHVRPSVIDLTPGAYSSIDWYPAEAQKADWIAAYPKAASLIDTTYAHTLPASVFTWSNNVAIAYGTVIESVRAGSGNDTITGNFANNAISGGAGDDRIFSGLGDDLITDASGLNYLRGDEGNDSISGGSNFDDINGNAGADTAHGNDGQDWVVGGKDNDQLFGDGAFDIVYGNLGDDTVSGGDGADWVRGGQGNDSVSGGDGDDWLWGDRGDDTVSGGAGADVFHSFSGAGIDRITDFNLAEGDRIQLDPGTTSMVSQVGADTVVDMGNGDQLILVGIQLSTLTGNWIFVA